MGWKDWRASSRDRTGTVISTWTLIHQPPTRLATNPASHRIRAARVYRASRQTLRSLEDYNMRIPHRTSTNNNPWAHPPQSRPFPSSKLPPHHPLQVQATPLLPAAPPPPPLHLRTTTSLPSRPNKPRSRPLLQLPQPQLQIATTTLPPLARNHKCSITSIASSSCRA